MKRDKKPVHWEERVFSMKAVPNAFKESGIACFTPFEDYNILRNSVKMFSEGKLSLSELMSVALNDKQNVIERKRIELAD